MKWLRVILPALFLFLAVPAQALTPPKITVTSVTPPVPAIRTSGGTSVEIRDPAEELILLDPQGQPFLQMTGTAVLQRTEKGWAEVRKENFYYVTDGEIGAAVLDRQQLPYPWQIKGTYGGKPFVITGTLVPPGTKTTAGTSTTTGSSGTVLAWAGVACLALLLLLLRYRPRRK